MHIRPCIRFLAGLFTPLIAVLAIQCQNANPNAVPTTQPSASLRLYYTGKLFGYYRVEPDERKHLRPVQRFLAEVPKWHAGPGWLLGMGDNFGPEFGASIEFPHHLGDECYLRAALGPAPAALYKDDDRIAPLAKCDNVTNFLMQAGYRAIVPGREDLIYSSFWLRGIANAFRDPVEEKLIQNSDHRLEMLAANLRVVPATTDKGSSTCGLLFAKAVIGDQASSCTAAGNTPTAFDWMDRLDKISGDTRKAIEAASSETSSDSPQTAPTNAVGRSDSNKSMTNGNASVRNDSLAVNVQSDEVRIRLANNDLQILYDAWGSSCGKGIQALIKNAFTKKQIPDLSCPKSGELDDREEDRKALLDYWGQLPSGLTDAIKNGTPISSGDMLLSPDAIDAAKRQFLRIIAREMHHTGYTFLGRMNPVLVVGVVGKHTVEAASNQNLRICSDKNEAVPCTQALMAHAATVKVFDPVSAIMLSCR